MKERLVPFALAFAFLAMAILFGIGAREIWHSLDRERDYDRWIENPGRLHSLTLHEAMRRLSWRWVVRSEYAVIVDGVEHPATRFDLRDPQFSDADAAKAFVEAALGIAGRARWRKVPYGSSQAWSLEVEGTALRVRHSPRRPAEATLTTTPPHAALPSWLALGCLVLLAAATAIGAFAMLGAALHPEPRLRSAAERARGEEELPLVPSAVRARYADRLAGAIAAMQELRDAEGSCAGWDDVLSDLRDEHDAAVRGPMRQRRHGLYLSRKLDLGCTTRAQERLQNEVDKVDAFVREHLVAADRDGGR